jgi:hypothetical protein
MNENQFREDLLCKLEILLREDKGFEALLAGVFEYQYRFNPLYRQYCQLVGNNGRFSSVEDIPFLPIELFKANEIKTGHWESATVFRSSGTTSGTSSASMHHMRDAALYQGTAKNIWESSTGLSLDSCHFYALLPSYLERKDSSLVFMMNQFMEQGQGSFYLNNYDQLFKDLQNHGLQSSKKPVLIGVSFALLDFIEQFSFDFSEGMVIETGGMKGRRQEILRADLHKRIKKGLNVVSVASEYGMTELFSQAYALQNGIFHKPSTMDILISDINDPFEFLPLGREGAVNIVDLANLDTVSFIGTRDLGKRIDESQFEITGRIDHADLRGCNLMVSEIF